MIVKNRFWVLCGSSRGLKNVYQYQNLVSIFLYPKQNGEKMENQEETKIVEWLESLEFTHSMSLQLPFCIKTHKLETTKTYIRKFMKDFELGIIYKKYNQQKNNKIKDTNDWQRRLVDFVVFFENHEIYYTPYHCHILLNMKKKNGVMYSEEEIHLALEYAKEKFAKMLSKKEGSVTSEEIKKLLVDYDIRQINPLDSIFHYDIKEFVQCNKITSIDRLEDAVTLLGVTRRKRPAKERKNPEKEEVVKPVKKPFCSVFGLLKKALCPTKLLNGVVGQMCQLSIRYFEFITERLYKT